jgi:DNA-binding beta-propeller fold protein YncE
MKKIILCLCCVILGGTPALWGQQTITLPYGSGPFAIDLSLEAKLAVVVNRFTNTVSVVKLTDYTFKTISLDKDANGNAFKDSDGTVLTAVAPTSVALFSGGTRAVVTNFGSQVGTDLVGTISILDTNPDKPVVLAMAKVGKGPRDVAIATKQNLALVVNLNSNTLSMIDLTTYKDVLPVPMPVGSAPISVGYDTDNDRAYIVNYQASSTGFNTVAVIDMRLRANIGSISLTFATDPVDIAISAATKHAIIAGSGSNNVTILDLSSGVGVEKTSIDIGPSSRPFSVSVNTKTNMLAVLSNGTRAVNLIDLADSDLGPNSKLKTVTTNISANPVSLAVNSDNNTALILDQDDSKVLVSYLGFSNYLPFAFDTATYRSNLVINNLSLVEANATIALLDKDGKQLATGTVKVPANGLKQINNINRYLKGVQTSTNTQGSLSINADQPITSFISLIDNSSNDPSLQVGRSGGAVKQFVHAVTNTGSFRSQLFILNLASVTNSITLTARNNDTGEVLATKTGISIPKNGFYLSNDVLSDMGVTGKFGPLEIESQTFGPFMAVTLVGSNEHTSGFLEAVPIQ